MSTKEKILHVAEYHFAIYGYAGTSMAGIAAEVGIKKPSLYSHYDSKEDIFKDVLSKEMEEYSAFVKEGLENEDRNIVAILYELLMSHLRNGEQEKIGNEFYYRFLKYQPSGLEEYTIRQYYEMQEMTFEILDAVLTEGKNNGEIDDGLSNRQIYDSYFMLIDGLYTMKAIYDTEQIKSNADGIWEVFHKGIKP